MHVDVIPINELTKDLKQSWLNIQSSNPNLLGPCFHPELFIAVGNFYPEIYVAILNTNDGACGFLPFLKDHQELAAKKIPYCDFETLITGPDQHWNMDQVLNKMGLNAWHFYGIPSFENIRINRGDFQVGGAPRVDLRQGYEKYLASLRNGRLGESDLMRNKRVLERTIGPVHFVAHSNDIKLIHQLIQWKVLRYKLEMSWGRLTADLYEHISNLNDLSFQSVVSALYAGEQLLAINYGLRYQNVFHGMMMAFNPQFEKYSVGQLLLYHLISEHKILDFKILDTGPQSCRYKENIANSYLPIITGTIKINSLKERIKSINWLYRGIFPIVQARRRLNTQYEVMIRNLKPSSRF